EELTTDKDNQKDRHQSRGARNLDRARVRRQIERIGECEDRKAESRPVDGRPGCNKNGERAEDGARWSSSENGSQDKSTSRQRRHAEPDWGLARAVDS